MSKHTPGPLLRGYYLPTEKFKAIKEHVCVMRPDGALIAICGPTGEPASEADALLYAAAPELLERVRQRYAACECLDPAEQGDMDSEEFFDQHACADCHNDRAALSKAEGRS